MCWVSLFGSNGVRDFKLFFFLSNTWAGKILYKGLHVQINNLATAIRALGTIANITRFVLQLQKLPMFFLKKF